MKKRIKQLLIVRLLFFLSFFFPVKKVRSKKDRETFTQMWYAVWLKQNYAQREEPIVEKYSKYNEFSLDLLLKFLGILPIGTFRFIHNNKDVGLPTLNDFEVKKCWLDDTKIIETTLLTVKKRYRSSPFHLPSLVLMRELARYCKKKRLEGSIMACDKRLFFLMRRKLGFPIHQIGKERFYEGSITYPAYINTAEFHRIMRIKNPFFTS